MGEMQEFVNSLNQFLANLTGHQNPAQTSRDQDVPNHYPRRALPVPRDEGTSRQPARAAPLEQLSGDEPSPTRASSRRIHSEVHGARPRSLSREYQRDRGAQRNQQAHDGHNASTGGQRQVHLGHNATPAP